MAKKIFKGNSPKNARVKIDYSGVKPKVTFSYPSKQHQVSGSMFTAIFIGWVIIYFIGIVGYGIATDIHNRVPSFYDNKSISCQNIVVTQLDNQSFRQKIIDGVCLNKTKENIFLTFASSWKGSIKTSFDLPSLVFILLLFGPPCLIYFPFKKYWVNVYPKYQAWSSSKKIMTFNPKDVRYSDDYGYYCEVPVFKNIILDYQTKKDFDKYLNFIEIEEYKFKYYTSRASSLSKYSEKEKKRKLNRRKRRQLNEWIWYARFYFNAKPKQGKLTVLFK